MTTALEIVKNTSIEYTPSVIKFNDLEAFNAAMEEVVQQYDGYEGFETIRNNTALKQIVMF